MENFESTATTKAVEQGVDPRESLSYSGSEGVAGTSIGFQGKENPVVAPLVQEVFSMCKNYLEVKLDEKGKEFRSQSKVSDKQITQMKFIGNQKQFEHYAQVDLVFDKILTADVPENREIKKLAGEGKDLIRKRQKLIRIADKSAERWKAS